MKDFTELKSLQKQLSEQAAAKAQAEREQREREEQRVREANLFRESVGEVKPLNLSLIHIRPCRPKKIVKRCEVAVL